MLSVLIPVYNQDVRKLVNDLWNSACDAEIIFEIRVYDDRSQALYRDENRAIKTLDNVHYHELAENIGRSRIRNLLAREAQYNRLLFLDCDSEILDKHFIKNYLAYNRKPVVYGGRIYGDTPPEEKYMLHWKYGRKIESQNAQKRKHLPYESFHSNNFIIDKSLILKYSFNESLQSYGYEDIAFGELLRKKRIPIEHISNPVIHKGLDDNEVFLKKTRASLANLHYLLQNDMISSTRLTRYYERVKALGLISILNFLPDSLESWITQHLTSSQPSLKLLQLWKLVQYHRIQSGS